MTPTTERLHALDAVRGAALLLGVFFHATPSFLPGFIPMWIVMDTQRSEVMSGTFFVLHIFRMATFFILAGFFAHMTFHKMGALSFMRRRLLRIGLPLVIFWPLLFGSFIAIVLWAIRVQNGGEMPDNLPPPPPMTLETFPLTHLWFLYVLLLFYAAMMVLRLPIMLDFGGHVRKLADWVLAALFRVPLLLPALLAAPVALVMAYANSWPLWMGIQTPDTGLVPATTPLVTYGLAFVFGWVLHRQTDLLRHFKAWWWLNLIVGAGLAYWALQIVGTTPNFRPSAQTLEDLKFTAIYAGALWTLAFAFIGLGMQFFSGGSKAARYIADASYWIYLIHLPIVMVLQVLVSQWDWPWYAKYALILGVSIPFMLLTYQLLVRYTFIGRMLNGARVRPE